MKIIFGLVLMILGNQVFAQYGFIDDLDGMNKS